MGELDKDEQSALGERFARARGALQSQQALGTEQQAMIDMLDNLRADLSDGADPFEINRIITTLDIIEKTASIGAKTEAYAAKQKTLATTDALTNAYSKRFFDDTGALTLSRLNRDDIGSAAIVYIDIDKFKDFNTNYGHRGGDEALIHVTNTIKDAVRDTDVVARLGGDEFAVICVHKDKGHDFTKVRDHIYDNFDKSIFAMDGEEIPLSVSVGLANLTNNDSLEAAQERADQDMYDQKAIRHRVLEERQAVAKVFIDNQIEP